MTKKDQETDVKFIQDLAELLRENDLTEIQVKRDYGDDKTLNVRVTRFTPEPAAATYVAAPAAAPAPAPVAAPTPASASTGSDNSDPADHPGAATSPMVGTVYLQSEPGAPSFVSVGDRVEEGQTILIVEAMKTMNQIPAPKAGVVKRILVEDGSPVEFGSPLMIIE